MKPSLGNIIWIFVKSIFIPIISVLAIKHYNLFSCLSFINEDKQFDFGLTMYVAIIEGAFEAIKHLIFRSVAQIKCTFYIDERREDGHTDPTVEMRSGNMYTGKIWCHIIIEGNPKVLKRTKLYFDIPRWFSVQCESSPSITQDSDHLIWNAASLLSDSENGKYRYAESRIQISFISNTEDDNSIEFKPYIMGHPIKKKFVQLKTNKMSIKNLRGD